jgi:hypothetical protein
MEERKKKERDRIKNEWFRGETCLEKKNKNKGKGKEEKKQEKNKEEERR